MATMNDGALVTFFTNFGGWAGLIFSVLIFSNLLGDHRLARLAQYVLVGLSMGYLAVLAIQFGIRPLLATVSNFEAVVNFATVSPGRWLTLLLALLLFVAGCERMFRRGRSESSNTPLRWLGLIPLSLLVGVGVAALLIGVVRATIVPQATLLTSGLDVAGQWVVRDSWTRLLMLILSAGVLFHLTIHPERHLSSQIAPLRQLMQVWMWLGQRALWLVAGIFFARIFAARYTLLITLVHGWWTQIQTSGVGEWLGRG